MTEYLVISKSGCLPCASAKQWLSSRGHSYAEVILDTGVRLPDKEYISLEELQEKYPFIKTLPAIFKITEDGVHSYIGGYTDLVKT